jgi:hypothetical protein
MTRIELADAMLKGAHTDGVIEDKQNYISETSLKWCFACALGCALIGKYDGDYRKAKQALKDTAKGRPASEYHVFGDLLGVSPELALSIEHKHLNGMPIEQIAAWLKSEEVEVSINV